MKANQFMFKIHCILLLVLFIGIVESKHSKDRNKFKNANVQDIVGKIIESHNTSAEYPYVKPATAAASGKERDGYGDGDGDEPENQAHDDDDDGQVHQKIEPDVSEDPKSLLAELERGFSLDDDGTGPNKADVDADENEDKTQNPIEQLLGIAPIADEKKLQPPEIESENSKQELLLLESEAAGDDVLPPEPNQANNDQPLHEGPVLFTIANSNTQRTWNLLPYREKFQWTVADAPCHQFEMTVPDERQGHGRITLCIYRQRLESSGGSGIITHEEDKHVDLFEQRESKVYGEVSDFPGSRVYGRLVNTFFYGEVSLVDHGEFRVYVVEEVKLLSKLFHQSRKLFHNIVEVVNGGIPADLNIVRTKFNAVVTRSASLLSLMVMNNANRENLIPMPVVVLTTSHTSYITPGQPRVVIDEKGQMNFVSPGKIVVTLQTDGSLLFTTTHRSYTFRPTGTTMMKEGVDVTTLQRQEGSLAIAAVSDTLTYGCILPSHSFAGSRRGGYLCKVCLAADNQFQNHYINLIGRNDSTTIGFLSEVIDQVSWIYRSVDWNGDGKPDNIGLDYDEQFSGWNYDDDGGDSISKETLEVLFESLSNLDFSDCCLGIAYTMKKFPHDIYAKASTSTPTDPGGICTLRKDGVSKNVILISAHSKSEETMAPLTASQLIYLTAHEIGKAFGAGQDVSGQTGCDSFEDELTKTTKHYLLWPDVFRPSITLAEKSFSKCSKKDIVVTLDSCKSSCFEVDLHPFCGNGVKEEGEECDCGSEQSCSKQVCCYGRTGKFPCRKTGLDCGVESSATVAAKSLISMVMLLGSTAVISWMM